MRLIEPTMSESGTQRDAARSSGPDAGRRGEMIRWPDVIETGYPEIDSEHRDLVAQCNELMCMVNAQAPWTDIVAAVNTFGKSVTSHFRTEERFLEQTGFSRTAKHKLRHLELQEQLAKLVACVSHADGSRQEDWDSVRSLPGMLTDILVGLDLDYKSHLQNAAGR